MRSAALLLVAACSSPPTTDPTPIPNDSDTAEPQILPIDDTAEFLPIDTSVEPPPDIVPTNWLYLRQSGRWELGSASPPFDTLTGTLDHVEYVDELDTAIPVYECNVRYSLTGEQDDTHSCTECDFVFNVEHYVVAGDPGACNDPDAPTSGAVWQMGFDQGAGIIYFNYYGTGVWLEWYDATKSSNLVDFSWEDTLAIDLEDTGQ
jgi:hypothetical protein